jgi:hypothetical protein
MPVLVFRTVHFNQENGNRVVLVSWAIPPRSMGVHVLLCAEPHEVVLRPEEYEELKALGSVAMEVLEG